MELCRTCCKEIKHLSSVSISTELHPGFFVFQTITDISSIQVKLDDGLSQNICNSCKEKLDNLYDFRNTVVETDKLLRGSKNVIPDTTNDLIVVKTELKEELSPNTYLDITTDNDEHEYKLYKTDPDSEDALFEDGCLEDNKTPQVENAFTCSEEGPFKCSECSKHKVLLREHEKIHGTDKPFECETCHRRFRLRQFLIQHQRTHTDERPFMCELCSRAFKHPSGLYVHMLCHDSVKEPCPVCGKEFNKYSLKVHMKAHNPERNHECTVCDKKFKERYKLNRHMRVHDGLRGYTTPE